MTRVLVDILKVKAHSKDTNVISEEHQRGNNAADEAAKRAAKHHDLPQIDRDKIS